ncbi:DUF4976 domain-containing protein [Paenibacillus alkaliterrae]|nr:DUF4976 domain-containing protein [Paenibacillus alkaliterrae]
MYYYADALGTSGSIDEPKTPEWELFNLKKDPYEMINVYDDPDYENIVNIMEKELYRYTSTRTRMGCTCLLRAVDS